MYVCVGCKIICLHIAVGIINITFVTYFAVSGVTCGNLPSPGLLVGSLTQPQQAQPQVLE